MRYTLEERIERAKKTQEVWKRKEYREVLLQKQKALGLRNYPTKTCTKQ